MIVFEPSLDDDLFNGVDAVRDMDECKHRADIIIAHHQADQLDDVAYKAGAPTGGVTSS